MTDNVKTAMLLGLAEIAVEKVGLLLREASAHLHLSGFPDDAMLHWQQEIQAHYAALRELAIAVSLSARETVERTTSPAEVDASEEPATLKMPHPFE